MKTRTIFLLMIFSLGLLPVAASAETSMKSSEGSGPC